MYFTVVIAAYKHLDQIRRSIKSVYAQDYRLFEILVCSDGEDSSVRKLVDEYKDPAIKYHFVEHEGEAGCRSRNEMAQIAKGNVIISIDQDDEIYRNCFLRIVEEWDEQTGLLIYRINHQKGVIPEGEKIKHKNIDTLNGVVKTSIARRCEYKNIPPSADSEYYKQVEEICKNEGHKITFIKDILGVHN